MVQQYETKSQATIILTNQPTTVYFNYVDMNSTDFKTLTYDREY